MTKCSCDACVASYTGQHKEATQASRLQLLALLLATTNLIAAPSENLLPKTAHWEKLVIGAPAQFSIDSEVHSGAHSMRIDAKETARSYWRSDAVPVAPGEQIHGGAWVKLRDVPEKQGAVIVIAEFTDSQGHNLKVEKFGTANTKNQDWQHVEGVVKVPEGAAQLRLRLGFSYCHGTIWW